MTRHLALGALVFSSLTLAQPRPNRVEQAKDRQDLRQDNRQLVDDRLDAVRAAQLLRDYDAAAARNEVPRLGAIDAAFNAHLTREVRESQVESAQARSEVREGKRELAGDKRELRKDVVVGPALDAKGPGAVADDRRDKNRDQVNLADDRRDVARERLSRERLMFIQSQLGGLAGRFDPPSVAQKRQLYVEVVGNATGEVRRDQEEKREDTRELREDRRERREDRRQR